MSVGGKIISVTIDGDRAHVAVVERHHKSGRLDLHNATAVWVEHAGKPITPGDSLWWQGDTAFWTARSVREGKGGKSEVRLKRLGFSHDFHEAKLLTQEEAEAILAGKAI